MTPNKEDYLKMIFELGGAKDKVSNKQLVSGLGVSAASVSEMMTKLLKEDFVVYTPYQGVTLTKDGQYEASRLIRKHRLWEVFLVDHLGFAWETVDEEAEVLEHVSSDELTDRLDVFLGHPENCPHGGIIPHKDDIFYEVKMTTLDNYREGAKIKIQRVIDDRELLDYLQEIHLHVNDVVKVEKIGSYEGPITLSRDGEIIQISFKAAGRIYAVSLD